MYKYIDLTAEASQEYLETSFFRWASPSEFSHGHSLADENRMAINMRGGTVKSFHFAEVIKELPLNGRIIFFAFVLDSVIFEKLF